LNFIIINLQMVSKDTRLQSCPFAYLLLW